MQVAIASSYKPITSDDLFEKIWGEVTRDDYQLQSSAFRMREDYAVLHYQLGGRGPRISANRYDVLQFGYERSTFFGPTLHLTAWPEWMYWENLPPHGWDIRVPPLTYRLAPADPDQPHLVTVIGEREANHKHFVSYTFGRSRDYFCVRRKIQSSRSPGIDPTLWTIDVMAPMPTSSTT